MVYFYAPPPQLSEIKLYYIIQRSLNGKVKFSLVQLQTCYGIPISLSFTRRAKRKKNAAVVVYQSRFGRVSIPRIRTERDLSRERVIGRECENCVGSMIDQGIG